MKYDSRLIRRPNSQPPIRRTAWGFVTAAFWLFYLYLWAPLVTFLLWVFGIHTATYELYLRESHVEPFLLFVLPLVALACAVVLIAWAEYNRFRFRGRDRRRAQDDVPIAEIAAMLGADAATADALGRGKVMTLSMDEHARPLRTAGALAAPQP
ncbi:poly-beta-1,6-N-acetyl-D-glucosamine biosynthesis protein PgaD [Luteimonas sp. R10]|uniref:poly-beta-1,6-N-acetyl-D-glucosamine biosynthesis protein PgaD n=1 Tax=Luteimonas sp. R10 TaxID=3108176 RepID=UPI003093BA3C|nr:poly-beta-1,6-N-acetyl-D-glucosamine biosynthesis protein PgaD [Luteimonas sp. R10]